MADREPLPPLPLVLGWGNPDRDREQFRLYALDRGESPRWDGKAGRVAEQALSEAGGVYEGARFLLVHLGDRYTTAEQMQAAALAVAVALEEGPTP